MCLQAAPGTSTSAFSLYVLPSKVASLDYSSIQFHFILRLSTFLVRAFHVHKKTRPNKTTLSRIVAKLDIAGTDVHSKETRGYISELSLQVYAFVHGMCVRVSALTRLGETCRRHNRWNKNKT